jgi:precorrin-2 dehydrogenase/sirohydrochlorin ferrochelatase
MRSEVFPVGLRLSGRHCLVVGSGEEAVRRAETLVLGGAIVRVICEHPTDDLSALGASGTLALVPRAFDDLDLEGVWLAVLTDPDRALAERISRAAERRCVFFCAVDQPAFGSFSHLALARSGDVTLAISTNGKAPALARRLREELERVLGESSLGAFVERLARLRDKTPSNERHSVLGHAVERVRLTGNLEVPEDDDDAR